jgi:hypothetical protein
MVLEFVWGEERVIGLPREARTFVFRRRCSPADMQVRIAAAESRGRPALSYRRVYQLQPVALGSTAPPRVAVFDLRPRLPRRPDLRDLVHHPGRAADPHGPQLLRHKPARGLCRQLATAAAA